MATAIRTPLDSAYAVLAGIEPDGTQFEEVAGKDIHAAAAGLLAVLAPEWREAPDAAGFWWKLEEGVLDAVHVVSKDGSLWLLEHGAVTSLDLVDASWAPIPTPELP